MSYRISADGTGVHWQPNPQRSITDLRKKQPLRPAQPAPDGSVPAPARQKNAAEYLAGRSPGVMQSYAPNARPCPAEGWVEDDETVRRLARWREEAIY